MGDSDSWLLKFAPVERHDMTDKIKMTQAINRMNILKFIKYALDWPPATNYLVIVFSHSIRLLHCQIPACNPVTHDENGN